MTRNSSLDFLKISMAMMVVGLHGHFLADISPLGNYLTVNGLFRIAVPIFLIINGFFFYPFLSKGDCWRWMKRVVVLYVVWMLFYSYYWAFIPSLSVASFGQFLFRFVIGYSHLWYVSGLIGAALLAIIFRRLNAISSVLIIFFTFSAGVLIEYIGNYHLLENSMINNIFSYTLAHRNFLFFSFPFFYIGILINKYSIYEHFSTASTLFLSIFGVIFLLGESYLNFRYQENATIGADNLAFLIFACPSIFLFFQKIIIPGQSKLISLYSSAIYFSHILILDFLEKIFNLENTPLTFFTTIISILLSAIIIKVNKKFPYIL